MKKILSFVVTLFMFLNLNSVCFAVCDTKNGAELINQSKLTETNLDIECKSAYLIEASTGKVLYALNEYNAAPPASVTKIMTLLLVCEALDEGRINLSDMVSVSAKAASMGGSQVFLEEGERMSVEELVKCTVIASGNDASVALAEYVSGSETAFVRQMNQRAAELGLKNTNFQNTTGLDDTVTDHYSCAADIGRLSCELIKHEVILKYSSIWQDTIRNGEFTLTNTNRLVRYYDGCNGLKTGSTDKAGFCVSATAKRGNMQLIAVIMGAETSAKRNEAARILLDYGFANYALYERGREFIEEVDVYGGKSDSASLYSTEFSAVVEKSKINSIELDYDIPEFINAPVKENDILGTIIYKIDGKQFGKSEIFTDQAVEKIKMFDILERIVKRMICG